MVFDFRTGNVDSRLRLANFYRYLMIMWLSELDEEDDQRSFDVIMSVRID